jgi:hypothetical protein
MAREISEKIFPICLSSLLNLNSYVEVMEQGYDFLKSNQMLFNH